MHYVYILQRFDKEFYIGYTSDLKLRLSEHKSKYHCTLVYYEAYTSSEKARERERKLKYYGSAWRSLKTRIK